jgi:putative transposase
MEILTYNGTSASPKGIIGKKLFENFPEIKRRFFWGSGFWNPAYLMDNIGSNEESVREYIKNQKYAI